MLLIAGNGRNVGKTFVACEIIKRLAKKHEVTGIKITPHIYEYNEKDVVVKSSNYVVVEEKNLNAKDSSRMLQAGAKTYLIMAAQTYLNEAFEALYKKLPARPVVCESGGLHEYVNPGLFFFIVQAGTGIIKKQHLKFSPYIINNNGVDFDFNLDSILYKNNKFILGNG